MSADHTPEGELLAGELLPRLAAQLPPGAGVKVRLQAYPTPSGLLRRAEARVRPPLLVERVKMREEEIESLKEAYKILNENS